MALHIVQSSKFLTALNHLDIAARCIWIVINKVEISLSRCHLSKGFEFHSLTLLTT